METRYTSIAQTVRDGESAQVAMSNKRVLLVAQADAATGAAVSLTDPVQTYESNTPANLLNSTLVKTGAGTLARLSVGAAGTSITVTAYDNTAGSGTIIFGPYVLVAGASIALNSAFGTGLYILFSATTGTPNITVGYR